MKLWVEGKPELVHPFAQELSRQAEVWPSEPVKKVNKDQEVVVCLVRYQPRNRVTVVQIETADGAIVHIPFLDLVMTEVEEGRRV
jgi:hypothetical protein